MMRREPERIAEDEDRLIAALRASDRVPPAPDCRSVVLSRVSGSARRPAWAYAFAAVLVIALALGSFIVFVPRGSQTAGRIASSRGSSAVDGALTPTLSPREREKVDPSPTLPHGGGSLSAPSSESASSSPSVSEGVRGRSLPAHPKRHSRQRPPSLMVNRPTAAVKQAAVAPQEPAPEPENLPEPVVQEERSVAIAIASWPAAEEAEPSSYGYREHDPETGTTTTCSVTRSGNAVTIDLESTPGGEQPPVKGSIDHEMQDSA